MTNTNKITITADEVADILGKEYDDVDRDVLMAVVAALVAAGADLDDYDELIATLPVSVHAYDDGSSSSVVCEYGDDYEDAARNLWDGADYGDGDYCVTVSWNATDAADREIASGSFDLVGETAEPECPDGEHDWTSEGEGGCDENPGVWSTGGTSLVIRSHCRSCGLHRTERHTGSQRNPGECDTTEYEAAED